MASEFGDSAPSGKSPDPHNLDSAIAAIRAAAPDAWRDAVDAGSGIPVVVKSQVYLRAHSHATEWVRRATSIANSAEAAVAEFVEAEEHARAVLVDVVPRVVVFAPKDILPPLATPPDPVHASSIQGGFDPREHPATWSKREARPTSRSWATATAYMWAR